MAPGDILSCCFFLFNIHLLKSDHSGRNHFHSAASDCRVHAKNKFLVDVRRKGSVIFRDTQALHLAFISPVWNPGLLSFVRVWVSAVFWTDMTQPWMFVHPAFELLRAKGPAWWCMSRMSGLSVNNDLWTLEWGATQGCGNAVRLKKLL